MQPIENAIGPYWEWEINLSVDFKPPNLLEICNGLESAGKKKEKKSFKYFVLRFRTLAFSLCDNIAVNLKHEVCDT